ncbi:MAG: hypothetical protein OXT09_34405 [Myxococcales bacterium]|nr:hypothetical protein [Myxococcales bacterium]
MPVRASLLLSPIALLVLLAGCAAHPQYFTPGEKVRGTRADGHREALYQLEGKSGRFGEARVWSRGSVVTLLEGGERTVIHVGFDLNNTSGTTLELRDADVRLEVAHTDAGPITDVAPHDARTITVPAQSLGAGRAIFLMPDGILPGDVRSFRVMWTVHSGEQRYQGSTPFIERRDRYHHHHHHAYVIYDVHHPHYWHYRRLGYCYDIACRQVIVVPHRHGTPKRRTRVHP